MSRYSRLDDSEAKGSRQQRQKEKKKRSTREATGLTNYKLRTGPSKLIKRRRIQKAQEAGYSSREIEIIVDAPFKFSPYRWKTIRKHRKEKTIKYCQETGHHIPTSRDWKDYWKDPDESVHLIIESWAEAARRVDAMFGHLTIFDIFYEDVPNG